MERTSFDSRYKDEKKKGKVAYQEVTQDPEDVSITWCIAAEFS